MDNDKFYYSCLSSEQKAKFDLLSEILRCENKIHNLTRITDPDEIVLRHFCDSLAVVDIIKSAIRPDESLSLIDIGSGAGFPGLAIAIAIPEINVTSVDATGKKIHFQQRAIEELGLDNVTAVCGRAEELAREGLYREKFDFAVSRAVASLSMLAELAMGFVKPGGKFLAWKGQKANEELSTADQAIKTLGGEVTGKIKYSLGQIQSPDFPPEPQSPLRIVSITKKNRTPAIYPREYKLIKKQPLGD